VRRKISIVGRKEIRKGNTYAEKCILCHSCSNTGSYQSHKSPLCQSDSSPTKASFIYFPPLKRLSYSVPWHFKRRLYSGTVWTSDKVILPLFLIFLSVLYVFFLHFLFFFMLHAAGSDKAGSSSYRLVVIYCRKETEVHFNTQGGKGWCVPGS